MDPIFSRIETAARTMARLAATPNLTAALLSNQMIQFCPHYPGKHNSQGIAFDVLPDLAAVIDEKRRYDLIVLCGHNAGEEAILFTLRHLGIASAYLAWGWDHHHHRYEFFRIAALADATFVAHWNHRDYVNHPLILPGCHVPCPACQFSPAAVAKVFPDGLPAERQNEPYFGFGNYRWAERDAFLGELQREFRPVFFGNVIDYFRQPLEDRLRTWAERKAHIVVPVANDLSMRVWEALLTGQIPLVPTDVPDLDLIVPRDLQMALPILRYEPYSLDSLRAACAQALARFDAEGAAGVQRRHAFARDHHSLQARLDRIATFLRTPRPLDLRAEDGSVVWQGW
jgi:hypothetical protein